jgi:hypothetical protein
VALSLPAAARRWGAWRWLVVVSSAKQKQQLHHQQLTNGVDGHLVIFPECSKKNNSGNWFYFLVITEKFKGHYYHRYVDKITLAQLINFSRSHAKRGTMDVIRLFASFHVSSLPQLGIISP